MLGCVEVVVRGHHQCPQRPPSLRRLSHQWSAVSGAVPSTGRLGIHTPLLSPKYEAGTALLSPKIEAGTTTTTPTQRCPPPPPSAIHHPLQHLHPSSLDNANTSSSSNTPTTSASGGRPSSALEVASGGLLPTSVSMVPSASFSPSSSAMSPGGAVGGGANLISSLNNPSQQPPGLTGVLEGSSGGGYHGLLGLEGCSPQLGYGNMGDAVAGVVSQTSLALTSLGYGHTPIPRTRPPTGEEVACGVCGKVLCNKYVLKTHLRDMHGPRQSMQCPVCHRMYASLNSLRAHMSGTHKKAQSLPQMQQPQLQPEPQQPPQRF